MVANMNAALETVKSSYAIRRKEFFVHWPSELADSDRNGYAMGPLGDWMTL